MIRNRLILLFEQKFGANSFTRGDIPSALVSFPPAHNGVGELKVFEYGNELIVEIGKIAHHQFDNLNPDATPEAAEQALAEQVAGFVEDVFADKYIFWCSPQRDAGGLKHIDFFSENERSSFLDGDRIYFTWSGPLAFAPGNESCIL